MSSLGPIHNLGPVPPPAPHTVPTNLIHPSSSATSAASASILDRSSAFVREHKKAVLISASVALFGSAAYYYYYLAPAGSRKKGSDLEKGASDEDDSSTTKSGSKKKKSKKSKKKSVNDPDGPLLEEVVPPKTEEKKVEEQTDDIVEQSNDIASMTNEERNTLAGHLKTRGNTLFSKKDYAAAIDCYTRAIATTHEESAVFYSNRAAAYNSLTPPDHENVIKDCDSALKLDKGYLKALKRRASALEALDRDEEAVRDFTAVTLLEALNPPKRASDKKDLPSGEILEKILKKLSEKKAKTILETREPSLPSDTFITAYLNAFRPFPFPALPEDPSTGDHTLKLAYEALHAYDYAHAFTLVNEALGHGLTESWIAGKALGLNLRGTFKFLIGDKLGAKSDFGESLEVDKTLVQSRIKLASVDMELGDINDTFGEFEAAIAQDASNADIYYHRGQVYFIAGDLEKALTDYIKSSELDSTFIFSHIQKAVTQYRMGNVASAMASFRRVLKDFPDRSEAYNYYGELLLAENRFPEALEKFDRAIEIESAKSRGQNVLPLVNKANCVLRYKEDFPGCEALIKKAIDIDPECDVAVVTLAQISLQSSKIHQAQEMFRKAMDIARSEEELVQAITFWQAAKAQIDFMETFPAEHARLGALMAAGPPPGM
ncbi:Translocase of outer mitochondrial membrane complex, subunit TOM70/TOM72 [Phaffia rhodozyma]|uniref:Translocase of outer mitochondrial membrane complex, subunit TOM70/TOM72 n=1 Tax=Phaffia rhodozyma TaxID=264483 RepID=A0A0F7SFU9_PHARH|nr:Translocase of outer mitochondrial membrane complex, subunit TOM70/TOM72 [Phaffia rhodozyma]